MTGTQTQQQLQPPPTIEEDEINLLDYWLVIWKRRKMIAYVVAVTVILTAVYSLFIPNVYQAKTVIMPVSAKGGGGGGGGGLAALASQFGGLPGIAMPASASASEIINLLKSNILRERMIEQHRLMPILFYEQWDEKTQTWKKGGGGFSLNPLSYISMLTKSFAPAPPVGANARKKDPGVPDTWDALRSLDGILKVTNNIKENNIVITADFRDPELAAKLVEYAMKTLTDYMSSEAKRVATTNRLYLEQQLGTTNDPFIKQKTYNLIAEQIETAMMSEVKENFAFKVIDPPLAPDTKIKPKRSQMVMLSFVVALFAGIFVAFFLEYIDKVRMNRKKDALQSVNETSKI